MKPEVDQFLNLSAARLMGAIAPLLPPGFEQGGASLTGLIMMLAAQEYDRAAEIRAAENADMRALFKEWAPSLADTEIGALVVDAAHSRDESLKISALNTANVHLRRALIRLHEHAEAHDMRALEARIWGVLKASAERRTLRLA